MEGRSPSWDCEGFDLIVGPWYFENSEPLFSGASNGDLQEDTKERGEEKGGSD